VQSIVGGSTLRPAPPSRALSVEIGGRLGLAWLDGGGVDAKGGFDAGGGSRWPCEEPEGDAAGSHPAALQDFGHVRLSDSMALH